MVGLLSGCATADSGEPAASTPRESAPEAAEAEQRAQVRATARAMAGAGLSAERLAAPAGQAESPPAKAR